MFDQSVSFVYKNQSEGSNRVNLEICHSSGQLHVIMKRAWALFKSHPYISNVVGYTTLFATADLIQQSMMGKAQDKVTENELDRLRQDPTNISIEGFTVAGEAKTDDLTLYNSKISDSQGNKKAPVQHVPQLHSIDWAQTARVALVGFCFHANFNYHWLRGLERMLPGGGAKRVSLKVFLDQIFAAPMTISAFYIGLSTLEGAEDPLEDWRNKFWTSYKTGLVYWSTMQAVNFSLIPPVARTVFVGGVALGWTVFLCHFKQQKSDFLS
ncbi:mpv17-like protein isoform X2 [Megalobrama amblycephala]|uniref:mpv17-like protein isoform X2 n=1 Tax=Megalobrama amblycephala TaxID=75352 RepID=UPI0020142487|nr:mpv17-like protein isoform X2 [Megalobrama amblycephala]XP_048009286.1 mpv17-like protein isoform X2 [Megalobrama amblycephala]